jgi:hypothetical protein
VTAPENHTPYAPGHWLPPTPPPKTRGPNPAVITILTTLTTLLLAAAAIGAYLLVAHPAGLTEQDARRACLTAIGAEWDRRVNGIGQTDTTVVSSVQGIDVQEIWKTGDRYNVNTVVRYTLTTAFVDPINDTLALTCVATRSGGNVATTVTNR